MKKKRAHERIGLKLERNETIMNKQTWTLDIFNFFLMSELKPQNLATFHKICLKTIWHIKFLCVKIDVTMETTFLIEHFFL